MAIEDKFAPMLNVLGGLTQALNSLGAPRASTSRVAVGPSVCRDAGGSSNYHGPNGVYGFGRRYGRVR